VFSPRRPRESKPTRSITGLFSQIGFAALFILSILAFGANAQTKSAATAKKRILFIASYSPSFHSFYDQINGLKKGLQERGLPERGYVFDVEFLDSKRFPLKLRAKALEADLATKFSKLRPYDLVVTADDNALNFARDRQNTLFDGSKIVFLGVNNVSFAMKQNDNPNIVGVVERRSVGKTLDLVKKLFPKTTTLHVIGDDTPTGRINDRLFDVAVHDHAGLRVVKHSLAKLTYQQLFDRFNQISPDSAVFLNSTHRDVAGAHLEWKAFSARFKEVYAGPVFSVQKAPIGYGALGGKIVSHFEQGRAAAALAFKILTGTPSDTLMVTEESPNLYLFDHNELARFNLNKTALPRDAKIINAPKTILNEYAHWVVAGILVFALQLVLILVLTNNIRQRHVAEASLRDSDARFRAFFDNSPSIMYMKAPDHTLTMVNTKYLEFHGVKDTTMIGSRGGSSFDEAERQRVESLDRKVMESGKATSSELSVASHEGETAEFIITKFPIMGANREVLGIGGINTDVTALRRRETELLEARNQAEESARQSAMAAQQAESANRTKSRFVATMSHEIRTPMNGVLGMADVLSQTNLNEEQRDYVRTIRESGNSLLDLLNDILDLSKIEAGRIELEMLDVSVASILAAADGLWRHPASEKGIQFSIRNDVKDGDSIRSDPGRLRQIINNLVGNAIKFTHEGSVEVRVLELAREDDQVGLKFEVHDTGIGIDEDQIENLFNPFSQADSSTTRQYGGTGLGLTISKNLVEMFGGEIGVENAPGRGSTFWFTVVAERGDAKSATFNQTLEIDDHVSSVPSNKKLRILIAEDNSINQKVISSMLAPVDCQYDIVQNGLEAVAAVTRSNYDLVLMDIQMPQMDGVEATKRIRSLPNKISEIPIIAMTANAMQGDRENYLGSGMDDYVSKPIDQRELISAIVRRSDIVLPDIDQTPSVAAVDPEDGKKPLTEDAKQQLDSLIGDIDGLLDGTND
tara:strand:+ start:3819 stop:6752 length:2934 start_codon:yes stop_codon:yes gene_type:complete